MITDSFGSGLGRVAGEHARLGETHSGKRAAGDQFTARQPTWVAASGRATSYLGSACESGTSQWSQLR